jgi:hypothetical protein
MKQTHVRKLNLGKKTIARLNENETKSAQGGSIVSIIYVTGGCVSRGCATDFTRPSSIIVFNP